MIFILGWALLSASPAFADLDDEKDMGGINPSPSPAESIEPSPQTGTEKPNLGSPNQGASEQPVEPEFKPMPSTDPKKPGGKTTNPLGEGATNKHDSKLPIVWAAKGLRGSKDSKVIDLMNNVVVTQGTLKLEADKARVFFDEHDEVTKVVATGNVKVTRAADLPKDRIAARGNEAVFDNNKRTVTMIGRATLWRGGDVVRGKRITYSMDSGWISVDSVEGVVQPNEVEKP